MSFSELQDMCCEDLRATKHKHLYFFLTNTKIKAEKDYILPKEKETAHFDFPCYSKDFYLILLRIFKLYFWNIVIKAFFIFSHSIHPFIYGYVKKIIIIMNLSQVKENYTGKKDQLPLCTEISVVRNLVQIYTLQSIFFQINQKEKQKRSTSYRVTSLLNPGPLICCISYYKQFLTVNIYSV